MESELLDSTAIFRASAEVSELEWAEPMAVARLSRVNARPPRRALT
jgi:hypothetical protein